MAKEKKLVEAITSMEEDFAQWYTDVVKKAELVDYASVKGCMVIKAGRLCHLGKYPERTGTADLKKPAWKMFICHYLFRKAFWRKKKIMLKALRRKWHGLPMAVWSLSRNAFACVRRPKPCSVISMHGISSLTEIYRNYIISGVRLSAGKRQPARSCVPENSCGRKAIQPMLRQRKRPQELNRC